MIDRSEYYQTRQNARELFLSLKDSYKREKLSEKNKPEITLFLGYVDRFLSLSYLEFAIRLVSDKKFQLEPDSISKIYDGILKDKKLHSLLPRLIFRNWLYFKQNRPEAIDLLFMYLSPQKIRINQIVHQNLLVHYQSHFRQLNNLYQNRIFEFSLRNEPGNKELLKVFAKQQRHIRPDLRMEYMNQILADKTIKNRYFNAFIPTLDLFDETTGKEILKRISDK